jgi:hypothetical protein
VQQDALGLDVAMDHAMPVRIVQRVGHVARDPDRLVHAKLRLSVQLVPERLPFNKGHDVVEEPVRGSRIERRQDVRML